MNHDLSKPTPARNHPTERRITVVIIKPERRSHGKLNNVNRAPVTNRTTAANNTNGSRRSKLRNLYNTQGLTCSALNLTARILHDRNAALKHVRHIADKSTIST